MSSILDILLIPFDLNSYTHLNRILEMKRMQLNRSKKSLKLFQ